VSSIGTSVVEFLNPTLEPTAQNLLRHAVTKAQFEDGSVSVEAGLMKMLTMMQSGRFKVFKHLNDCWEEFRLYHRKDGKVVKDGDDLMAATRDNDAPVRVYQAVP
jgi:terminase large subunit-like protein